VSFRREKYVPRGGPDGGDGGRGGHVILRADPETDSLIALHFRPHQRAESGRHGSGSRRHGRNGRDCVTRVPCGTEVWDAEESRQLADLVAPGEELIVAEGGRGGLGNPHWQTSTYQTPWEHTDGKPGQQRTLRLELKVVADVGLVGLANAGKSSLLRRLTHAHPKVAAYPFTTLNPVIGTIECEDYARFTLADIPGLIRGAHEGAGLGDRFLRHIERAPALLLVVDMAGSEGRDPCEDYTVLRDELRLYNPGLLRRPFLVAANKMDLPAAASYLSVFRRKTRLDPLPVSALTGEGLDALRQRLVGLVRRKA
jgi:GTP-binding protein